MSLLTPLASQELDEPAVTNLIGPPKCVRGVSFNHLPSFFSLPFPNVLYGLTATWIRELNPKDLGKSSIWRARVWGQFEFLGFALTMLSLFEESAKKKQKNSKQDAVCTQKDLATFAVFAGASYYCTTWASILEDF